MVWRAEEGSCLEGNGMEITCLHMVSGTDDNGSRDLPFSERIMLLQSCMSRLQNPEVEGLLEDTVFLFIFKENLFFEVVYVRNFPSKVKRVSIIKEHRIVLL